MTLSAHLRHWNLRLLPRHLFAGPEWLVLGVNNACNLRCRMCDVGLERTDTVFARNLTGTRPLDMPFDLYERIVAEAVRHAPQARIGFAFTEPLLWKPIVDAVALATRSGLATGVTTNGWRLPELADGLADAGLGEIFLSIDGLAATHDAIRGRAGSFDRLVTGLERTLATRRPPRIGVYCVITPWNQGELAEFVRAFARFPLAALGFLHANFTTAEMADRHNATYGALYPATDSNLGPFAPADLDLPALEGEIARARAVPAPFPVAFAPEIRSLSELRRYYLEPESRWGSRCQDAGRTLMIKSDGSAIPAHGRCYEVAAGNIRDRSLPEIWNSPAMGDFRATLARAGGLLPACTRCCSSH